MSYNILTTRERGEVKERFKDLLLRFNIPITSPVSFIDNSEKQGCTVKIYNTTEKTRQPIGEIFLGVYRNNVNYHLEIYNYVNSLNDTEYCKLVFANLSIIPYQLNIISFNSSILPTLKMSELELKLHRVLRQLNFKFIGFKNLYYNNRMDIIIENKKGDFVISTRLKTPHPLNGKSLDELIEFFDQKIYKKLKSNMSKTVREVVNEI